MTLGRVLRVAAVAALTLGFTAIGTLPALAGPNDIVVTIPERGDPAPPQEGTRYDDAQLRWGLNAESGGGAYAGGCNFLSAGVAGDNGASTVWAPGLYRAQEGAVRIEKPTASGAWTTATWDSKCLDPSGSPVTTTSAAVSGNQVVIDGGTGAVRDGKLEIRWTGSFTVVYYGGMTYWSVSDPVLTLDASGNGQLTGTASGYGADMDDVGTWEPITAQHIVLAEIRGAATSSGGGFTVTPQYLGVQVDVAGGVPQSRDGQHWGAFPQSFVDFQRLTGQHAYWYSSGGIADRKKPATPIAVSYDASTPLAPPPVPGTDDSGTAAAGTPSNPLRLAPAVAPAVAAPALAALAANAPLTTQPQRDGLVPAIAGALPPLVPPLLGSAAALSVGIVAVLSMMQLLPWQRVTP